MAGGLQSLGVIDLFSGWAGLQLSGLDLPWPALFAVLHLLFFAMHYLFASQTAHVGALFAAFCSLMISAGEGAAQVAQAGVLQLCLVAAADDSTRVPPQLAAMSLAYNVNLFGSLTHYASGQAAVYFGAGYLKTEDVFLQGAACAAANLLLWASVGMLWWKVLGWY
ncbi:2-oxoglutarate/malate translocator [Scenedesmus sp. NREL 46B-D3]|nr:2-oxoglutarate/malate translocator [Scenedesmus sp. NREL 46B-D3]